jgi:FtsH-binding integral membrane protein
MGLVAVTAALFTLGAYLARNLSGRWSLVFWIAWLACLLAMNVVRRSEQLTLGLLFGFGVLGIFVSIPGGSVVYALLGLVIFAGLVMYDFQRLRVGNEVDSAPLLATSIFLDMLNSSSSSSVFARSRN